MRRRKVIVSIGIALLSTLSGCLDFGNEPSTNDTSGGSQEEDNYESVIIGADGVELVNETAEKESDSFEINLTVRNTSDSEYIISAVVSVFDESNNQTESNNQIGLPSAQSTGVMSPSEERELMFSFSDEPDKIDGYTVMIEKLEPS